MQSELLPPTTPIIISTDAEKALAFTMKAQKKLGTEGTYSNIIKIIHDKPIANIILNREKLKPFPLKDKDVHSPHSYSSTYS
jgi:hypothetical protein